MSPRGRGRRRHASGMLLAGWTAIAVAAVLVGGTLYGYVQYRTVWDGITKIAVTGLGKRPPKYGNAKNILVIGSDSRSGANAKIGGYVPGQRSDTVMIVHISPGRSRLSVLSFPRDSVVPILACPAAAGFPGQQSQPAAVEQLNSSFAYGGPGCLWHTLEQTTRIRIDDFLELNFTGFISVINALGGVRVCLPYAIHPTSYDHLKLSAGPHVIKGYKALEFWRLREGFGLGSDLQRIQRDQLLMVALVQQILRRHVLRSPTRSYGIVQDIVRAHALTTDTGLTPSRLLAIATSMSGISRQSVQFVEVPTIAYPANPNWVEFDPASAPKLFTAVAHDIRLPKTAKQGRSQGTQLIAASRVRVEVLNGSGVTGIAGRTAAALATRGFHVLGAVSATTAGGAPDFGYTASVVEYGAAADLAAARTVAAQLSGAALKRVSAVPAGTVHLILGSSFTALSPRRTRHPLGNLAARYSGFSGSTNVCKNYGTAFMTAGG
ncbi:MAG: LCP family protein [Streptosporangiaceae bacterium]